MSIVTRMIPLRTTIDRYVHGLNQSLWILDITARSTGDGLRLFRPNCSLAEVAFRLESIHETLADYSCDLGEVVADGEIGNGSIYFPANSNDLDCLAAALADLSDEILASISKVIVSPDQAVLFDISQFALQPSAA